MNKLIYFTLLLFAGILFLKLYTPAVVEPLSLVGKSSPIILAHRGSRVLNPENTILAFQNAIDFGADVIETDVQLTKDGELIVFHDDEVDRVTNGVGLVANFTVEEIKKLDAGYKFTHDNGTTFPFRGKGVHLSTIAEVFDTFPNAFFNIELKNESPLSAEKLYEAIRSAKGGRGGDMTNQVAVVGRWCSSVKHFRRLCNKDHIKIRSSACEGEVISFILHSFFGTSSVWYSLFYSFPALSLQVPTISGPFHLDTAVIFRSLKSLGKHVHYWVINDPTEMKRLLKLGAHGIITDRPDIAVGVFEELGLKEKREREIYSHKNERFFVPVDNHIETHTCVGFLCAVLQMLDIHLLWVLGGFVLAIIYVLKRFSTKRKKE